MRNAFPAKWARINGRITELRKIRGEIKKSDDYSAKEKSNELKHLAELLRESIAERSRMMKQPAYRESIKQGTIR